MINHRAPSIVRHASMEDIHYRRWVLSFIDSMDPSHCAFQVWCCSLVWPLSYSLSKITHRNSYNWRIVGRHSLLFSEATFFSNLGKFQDPSAVHLIFVAIVASGTEGCCWMLNKSCSLWLDSSVDAANNSLGLWCRNQWFSATQWCKSSAYMLHSSQNGTVLPVLLFLETIIPESNKRATPNL